MHKSAEGRRTEAFQRNVLLEALLDEINHDLECSEQALLSDQKMEFPLIFIVGAHRSGTTLVMQWLASLGSIAYPTNLMSRFYKAPIIASKIQMLLTDERYNYRNEIMDFNSHIDFSSENGKTKGALAPNEYYYFWRRFLPFDKLDYLPTQRLLQEVDTNLLKTELAGVVNVFKKPFAMKGMILNYNIDFLEHLFDNAIFIHVKRNPFDNIISALEARKRQTGNIDTWYSFKIPEYESLIKLDPYHQVAGQIFYINKAVEKGMANLPEMKKIAVSYEAFCQNPKILYDELKQKLSSHGYQLLSPYTGEKAFTVSKKKTYPDDTLLDAYQTFFSEGK